MKTLTDLRKEKSSLEKNILINTQIIERLKDMPLRADVKPEARKIMEQKLESRARLIDTATKRIVEIDDKIKTLEDELKSNELGKAQGFDPSGPS